MNLAFALQKESERRDDNPLQPYKIVSLLAVLQFYAREYIDIMYRLGGIRLLPPLPKAEDQAKRIKPLLADHLSKLRWLHRDLIRLDLVASADSVERLMNVLENRPGWGGQPLEPLVDALFDNVTSELKGRLVMAIPANRSQHYNISSKLLGENIIRRFQQLHKDSAEAGKCLALGRYTACAFHLMRIMEHVVHQFAQKLDVEFSEEATWGTILRDVWQKKIDNKEWACSKSKKKKYSACYKLMDGIRGRRDLLIHHGDSYSEQDAEDLIGAVRSCIDFFLKLPDPD
jgi:hypothetical protein